MDRQEFAGLKHERLNELKTTPRTWVYTQALSDGRLFVQALRLDEYGNTIVSMRNASLEAYTEPRRWWIQDTVSECAWLTDMMGLEDVTADFLNSIPAKILEGQECESDGTH